MAGISTSWEDKHDYDWRDDSKVTKKTAREYAKEDKREYSGMSSKGIPSPVGKELSSDSPLVLALVVDVTGSMKKWPGLIFNKIPTLYNESNAALQCVDLADLKKGKSIEDILDMSVIAIGDAYVDSHPLQVVEYSKGPNLVNGVNKILPEGGGGPFGRESYELAAYFLAKHSTTPKVPSTAKPILIYAADEDFYDTIKTNQVKQHIGDILTESLSSDKIIQELAKKFDMYVLRPEPEGSNDVYDRAQRHWESLLGSQRVLKMQNPERLVDCIIGICAYTADNLDQGVKILERRQTSEQVRQVLETLHPLSGK